MQTSSEYAFGGRISSAANLLLDGLTDLLFPPHCAVCNRSIDIREGRFCAECRAALPFVSANRCPRCGHELGEYAAVHTRCHSCTDKILHFRSATAPFRYEEPVRGLILQMKLARRPDLAAPLADALADHLEKEGTMGETDVIVPVPLHWRRHLHRGYNQALLIARTISRRFDVKLDSRSLRRLQPTGTQTSLTMQARLDNLKGAFGLRRSGAFRGLRVLLIDDVLTTGATCAECSRVLMRAGSARAVRVATVARTML